MYEFQQQVALITGAGSGIGRAIAAAFARQGAAVMVSDQDVAAGTDTVSSICAESGNDTVGFTQADITEAQEVERMVGATLDAFGRLDFGINCAGIAEAGAKLDQTTEDEWRRVIEVNLTGTWLCMKHEIDPMLAQGQGAIVNIASVAGLVGYPRHGAYAASKHGVVGLTKSAALEYARSGIRVNAVCPGFTSTPMVHDAIAVDEESEARLLRGIPMRRLGQADEIAAAVLYLCSAQAGFVTGHTLTVDGGLVAG